MPLQPDDIIDGGQVVAGLPAPLPDEPAELRRAIADELADHLSCAMQRETRRCQDSTEARRAVLARFGDPARIARRLWLDAMKESIMNQRFSIITNLVLALACVAMVFVVWSAMRQNAMVNQQMMTQLGLISASRAADTSTPWAEATVGVNLGKTDGPPVAGLDAVLSGHPFNQTKYEGITTTSDEHGRLRFGPILPGNYQLEVEEAAGLTHSRNLVLYAGHHETPVIWPEHHARPTPVAIAWNVPDLGGREAYLLCSFAPRSALQSGQPGKWAWSRVYVVVDAKGRSMIVDESRTFGQHQILALQRFDAQELRLADTVSLDSNRSYQLLEAAVYLSSTNPSDASQPRYTRVDRETLVRDLRPPGGHIAPVIERDTIVQQTFTIDSATPAVWNIQLSDRMVQAIQKRLEEQPSSGG